MPERVLIVDDDPVQRRLLENIVTRTGYQAVVADSGDAAVALSAGWANAPCGSSSSPSAASAARSSTPSPKRTPTRASSPARRNTP